MINMILELLKMQIVPKFYPTLLKSLCMCHAMTVSDVIICQLLFSKMTAAKAITLPVVLENGIASVTLAVILWDSRPFSRMVSFPPWQTWISHITSYPARQAEAQLGSWHVFAHRHNTLHPTLPTPPAWFFMPLVVPQSAHAGKGGNHNGQFHCWRRTLFQNYSQRETKGLFMGEWRYNVGESR